MATEEKRRRPSLGGTMWGVIGAVVAAGCARWIVGLVVATEEVKHHAPPSGTLTATGTLSSDGR